MQSSDWVTSMGGEATGNNGMTDSGGGKKWCANPQNLQVINRDDWVDDW